MQMQVQFIDDDNTTQVLSFFNIRLNHAQIDLRFVLYSLGFRGGLKGVERQLGADRGNLRDVDGFFAVLLWEDFLKTQNRQTLETLLAYNVQDTITLENLMVTAYNLKLRQTPFYDHLLIDESISPPNPYKADLATIDRIKNSSQYWASDQWH
jgi:hypothetical protein